ncbi:hypothetical protein Bca4012_062492 [Brassica carinata]
MNLWYKSMVVNEVMTEIFNTSLRSIGDHAISDAQQHLTRSQIIPKQTLIIPNLRYKAMVLNEADNLESPSEASPIHVNVRTHAISDAQQHLTKSHAYSFIIPKQTLIIPNLRYKAMVLNEADNLESPSEASPIHVNVRTHAISDAQQHLTKSHAYSFVTIVVKSVCACHPERMEIDKNVLVMIR